MFAGVGERTREGNDLLREMTESKVIDIGEEFYEHYESTGDFDIQSRPRRTRWRPRKAALIYGR